MYMENLLETIKANLPYGYEKKIAKEVGCSQGTVHNILNLKRKAVRSNFKIKVLQAVERMANENLQAMQQVNQTVMSLDNLNSHGTTS